MVSFVNKEILEKLDEIILEIKQSEKYQNYQFLKEKLMNNKNANELISDIKRIQKEIVKKEVLKKEISELEEELNKKVELLNKIPLYVEFIEVQEELNITYQLLKQELEDYFNDLLD